MANSSCLADVYSILANTPSASSCATTQGLLNGVVAYSKIAQDCKKPVCSQLLYQLQDALSVFSSTTCVVYDSELKENMAIERLYETCYLYPTSDSSTTTNSTRTTPSPFDEFTPSSSLYDYSSSSSSSSWFSAHKTIVIGAGVGVIIVLAIIIVICCKCRKKRTKEMTGSTTPQAPFVELQDDAPPPPMQNPPPQVKNPPPAPPKRQSSTIATTETTNSSFRQSHGSNTKSREESSFRGSVPSEALDMCGLDVHRIPSAEIKLVRSLAQGAYGEVWLADYFGRPVAAKRLLPGKNSIDEVQKFIWEIKLVSKIECPFIVEFVGVAWTRPVDMMLLTEFMERGDLRSVLQQNAIERTFTWQHKVVCALHIAEALVYLHTMDPKIIHRDLKSRNVLLNSAFEAKVTDFGIARETDDIQTMTAGIGTYRWMAPEVLQDGHYTDTADIFSFGVILAELDVEVLPYSDLRNDRGNPYTDAAIMGLVIAGQLKPSFSPECPRWFHDLGLQCLQIDPSARPSAMQVAYQIRSRLQAST
ncbi:hypothetical protein Ae201684P_012611 [Aphanomyces euteiches]|uniref:Protein kinase domain-containing protein n=1 Tax=Aphanomyces euteiches TaxID=100861 RepID=A0A6G0W8S4_9STRA|nr:hypothetical protein Ae201684_017587 [Aphanomyces euteiches]KAH9076121.1 hypothetical protein Ae201684P_012611 [Aphanomyces euteiches]KAH9149011.1 hypothetical protein AeRB84_007796 [Aphanomyces euteiches]